MRGSVGLLPSKTSNTGETTFKKNPNYLKSLEIVLKAYSKEKNIHKNLLKYGENNEGLWHWRHNLLPIFHPLPSSA